MTRPLHALVLLALVAPAGAALAGTPPARPPARPIDRASPTTGPDGAPLTPRDLQELQQMEEAIKEYEWAKKEYTGTITHIVRQEYEKKRRELIARYDRRIEQTEDEEKQRRLGAIAAFEAWLKKYPSDRHWTPDVIFRLAELYFERSNDEYLAAVDAAQKAADAAPAGDANAQTAAAAPPTPDYTLTLNLYKRLIAEFSDYRLIDGAYYLLGYCHGEMNHEPDAKQAYLALVCGNQYKALDPPAPAQPTKNRQVQFVDPYEKCVPIQEGSRFVPEAWTRIGEYHFDANELELAIAAYARVLKYEDSPYYDKALYKLAWSYYRADKYPEAIKKFDELVHYSDSKKSESGKEGSDLRQEAVQYLGISFAEKDWNGDGIDDPQSGLSRLQAFYRGRDEEPHVRDIYQRLGDIYFDETEYAKAIEVYKALLAKWPYDKDDFKVQDKIVTAYKRMRDQDSVIEATEAIAKNYGRRDSDWAKHQDKETLDAASELAEQAMVTVAVEHHKNAQALKKMALGKKPPDGAMLERAAREYAAAADAYQGYLQNYPNSKNTYDYTFSYAETLYYSQRFVEAAAQYEKVRDSNLDNRYLEDAAFDAIKSYENQIAVEVSQRRLVIPPIPEAGKVPVPVQPQAVPDLVRKLQNAYDQYVQRLPQSPKVPTMLYKAAEIDFKYLDFDKTRPRMEKIVGRYCQGNDVGAQAGNAILVSYTIEKNLDKILEWTDRILKGQCGSKDTIAKNEGNVRTLRSDTIFQKAQQDFDAGRFEQAADEFIKIVDGDPQNKSGNNDKALNNAAVGYEKVSRFQAATKTYERIVAEYPSSPFVDDALFRTAVNYQRFFEFDKAVVSYRRLATDPHFKGSANRANALYNAAVILENDQDYASSAKLFQQYATLSDANLKKEDQGEAWFRSGLIYLKAKDPAKAIKTFRQYLAQWPTADPKKQIEARYRIAEAYEQQKDHRAALAQYRQIIDQGTRVAPASDAAEYPAQAAFLVAEQELPVLEKMKISGDPKTLKRDIERFQAEIQKLTAMYEKAIAFRRAKWALAAFFRIGYGYEMLSRALGAVASAPCPKDVMRKYKQEGCDLYLQQLTETIEKLVAPIDDEVVKRYRVTLEQAARFGASNEWTKLARQRANAYKPEEFPLVKDEKIDMQLGDPR